ncbi:Protein of unknown function (DUF3050) [Neolewinella xylanilytica]|uniref:DUF3050 family protein n=1 Tax=Neolewinella xylanilytica TaxID=1514080 RepID=A0A2S6I4M3_9BACT|nr:DUF3050 domain-containing protein [Neolewinella xylanilytica]PPK86104.1 Protein of unknown function (DUF3050) [Neolewinella xylanilytica]
MHRIETILQDTQSLQHDLTGHRLYDLLNHVDDIRVFMERHVYAVWDFMSLLKALQNELTCTALPWKPAANPRTARFINEIVLGEETDVDRAGQPASHFDLYLEAMEEVGAPTGPIRHFLQQVSGLDDIRQRIAETDLQPGVKAFLDYTFELIIEGQPHKIAAAFTFGRESLIPELFIEILNRPNHDKDQYPRLVYYLERHIEVDGDEHGPLSEAMVTELCGDDERKWREATEVAQEALRRRIGLWDEIAKAVEPVGQV